MNTNLKTYLTDKLKNCKNNISRLEKEVISCANSLEVKSLIIQVEYLKQAKELYRTLLKDCIKYLTVDEIIEIANTKKLYSGEELENLIDSKELTYTYRFDGHSVYLSDRDKLITRFGHDFKDLKVK